jgi:hypothetical protein
MKENELRTVGVCENDAQKSVSKDLKSFKF